jgi:SAM-dependent methyltransferase
MDRGLSDLPATGAILAVGCDAAFIGSHLVEYSRDVTVLDTSGGQLAQLARRFPEISFQLHNPASPLPFPRESFEVVWCCDYLDRVLDPAAALREIHRVLAANGRLLASVPQQDGVRKMLSAFFPAANPPAAANPAVRFFTRRMLTRLARENGFVDIAVASIRQPAPGTAAARARSLLMRARKAPGVQVVPTTARVAVVELRDVFDEELAFAGRTRAA